MRLPSVDFHSVFIDYAQKIYEKTGVVINRIDLSWERTESMTAQPEMKIKSVSIDSTKEQ